MVRAPTTSDLAMTAQVQVSDLGAFDHGRAITLWLYAVAALVRAMVLVGGATRLTESGLSITEWKPVMGVVPPQNGNLCFAQQSEIAESRRSRSSASDRDSGWISSGRLPEGCRRPKA